MTTLKSTPFRMRVRAREIAINMPARETLLNEIRERLINGAGFALATINLDHLVKLKDDAAFGEAYAEHDFVVADGNPVVWLSRLAGKPVDLVPGSDLVAPLAKLAAETDAPVALFGSTQEALDQAAEALMAQTPDLKVVARLAPSGTFDPQGDEADGMIDALAASGARLTFVALGAPKQEVFAARARQTHRSHGLCLNWCRAGFYRRSAAACARMDATRSPGMAVADGLKPTSPRVSLRAMRDDPAPAGDPRDHRPGAGRNPLLVPTAQQGGHALGSGPWITVLTVAVPKSERTGQCRFGPILFQPAAESGDSRCRWRTASVAKLRRRR